MKKPKVHFLLLLTKNLALLALFTIAIARIFFPTKFENAIISPVKKMPVFGKVLGATWETTGDITDLITNKTVELADDIETNDLNIDEKIKQIGESENPGGEIKEIVEDSVQYKIEDLKDLPAEKIEEIKDQIRDQMYQQVCGEWLKEENADENIEE